MAALVLAAQALGLVVALVALAFLEHSLPDSVSGARLVLGLTCVGIPTVALRALAPTPGTASLAWSASVSLSSAAALLALIALLGRLIPPWLAEQHRNQASAGLLMMYAAVLPLTSLLGSFLGSFLPLPTGARNRPTRG